MLAIDRGLGELVIVRDDVVLNPSDRVYIGDAEGVTLTLPTPDGTLEAEGSDALEGEYRHDGGVMLVAVPLRPGASVVRTQYAVGYDLVEDDYLVRLTAPVPTEQMELRVPPRFIRELDPGEGVSRGEDAILTGELEGERLLVLTRDTPAGPGEALIAGLVGLSGDRASLPLTERNGAIIASLLALLVLGGAAVVAIRRDPAPLEAPDDAEAGS